MLPPLASISRPPASPFGSSCNMYLKSAHFSPWPLPPLLGVLIVSSLDLTGVLSSADTPFHTIPLKQQKKLPSSCINQYPGCPFHLKENPNFLLRPKVSQITCPLSICSVSVLPFQECWSLVSWTRSLPGSLSSLSHGKIYLFHSVQFSSVALPLGTS